jgi:hypothetical protein
LILLFIGVLVVVPPFFGFGKPVATDLHSFYMLIGTLITMVAFIPSTKLTGVKYGGDNPVQLFCQLGLVNILLGLPMIRAATGATYVPSLSQLSIGVLAEESIRVGSAIWLYVTFEKLLGASYAKLFAAIGSAIVFAALHIYWTPSAWIYTIGLWFIVSIFFFGMGSAVACVGSHFFYDLLAFGYVNLIFYFGISIALLVIALPFKPQIGVVET